MRLRVMNTLVLGFFVVMLAPAIHGAAIEDPSVSQRDQPHHPHQQPSWNHQQRQQQQLQQVEWTTAARHFLNATRFPGASRVVSRSRSADFRHAVPLFLRTSLEQLLFSEMPADATAIPSIDWKGSIASLLQQSDRNGDSQLDQQEFQGMLDRQTRRAPHLFPPAASSASPAWSWREMARAEFHRIDTDRSGHVSSAEFTDAVQTVFQSPVSLPATFTASCALLANQTAACLAAAQDPIVDGESSLLHSVLITCRSGLSWVMGLYRTETCLLDATRSLDGCVPRLLACLHNGTTAMTPSTSSLPHLQNGQPVVSMESTTRSVSLSKRSAWMDVLTVYLLAITAFEFVTIATIALLTGIAVAIFFVLLADQSVRQVRLYWDAIQGFERWQEGSPELPCNTPYVYWNPQCGWPGTHSATTCVHGQPYTNFGCVRGWVGGCRLCGALGCRVLCMDVSRLGCPAGFPVLQLAYNDTTGLGMLMS